MGRRRKYSKKLKRKKTKNGRKAHYRSKAKTTKKIYGRKMIVVSKRHLKKKTQPRYTNYARVAAVNPVAGTWTMIWATNGTDGTNPYITMPITVNSITDANLSAGGLLNTITQIQGELDQGGVIGRRFYWLSVQLGVVLTPAVAATTNANDIWRIVVVQQRMPGAQIGDFIPALSAGAAQAYTALYQPIITRDWKVLLDKHFSVTTGYCTNGPPITWSQKSKAISLKFKIPFKYECDLAGLQLRGAVITQWVPPLQTYFMAYTLGGNLAISNVYALYTYINP